MTMNILDPAALLSSLPALLPTGSKVLASPHDALAALYHSIMVAAGFRLVAVDDDAPPSAQVSDNTLPLDWNKHAPALYTFKYKHEQSSLVYVLKVTRLGGRTLVNAIALESEKVSTLDVPTEDFTSPSFFPYRIDSDRPLVHGFISSNRVADLADRFKLKILQPLIPGLRKEGYTEVPEPSTSGDTSRPPRAVTPPPARPQPEQPIPPNYLQAPPVVPRNPLEIGRSDLDPFPRDLLGRPGTWPSSGDNGMFVGPDHPIFGAPAGRSPFGDRGPWGGDGFLPPMGAPPGARFDPVGPSPGPLRGPFGQGRAPRRSGEPDNDEFMPPGMGNMFM